MRASSASPVANTEANKQEIKNKTHEDDLNKSSLTGKKQIQTRFFHLKLKLQRVDLSDAYVPLLIDEVHLRFQNPSLALGVTESV